MSFTFTSSQADLVVIGDTTATSINTTGMGRGQSFIRATAFGSSVQGVADAWVWTLNSSCITVADPGFHWAGAGGFGQFTVIAEARCQWTVTSSDPGWLIPGPTKGLYRVMPNGSPWDREGFLSINGHNLRITQGPAVATPGCINGLYPASATVSAQGGTRTIDVSAPGECVWTTTTTGGDWLHPWTASGIGSGQAIYIVEPNPTSATRTASIVVNELTFEVTQEAGPVGGTGGGGPEPPVIVTPNGDCTYNVEFADATETTLSLRVLTNTGCLWMASSGQTGVAVSPSSGSGPSEILIDLRSALPDEVGEHIDLDVAGYLVRVAFRPASSHPFGIRIPIPCIDSNSPWCDIIIEIIVTFPEGGQNAPPEFLCQTSVERGSLLACGIKANTGSGARVSSWQFTANDGRTITGGSSASNPSRLVGGEMAIGGSLSVTIVWREQTFSPPAQQIQVRNRDWESRFPAPERLRSGYIPQLTLDDPPHFGANLARYWATHDGFGDVVAIRYGPNAGYSYARRKPSLLYLWAGSDAIFVPGSPNYDAFEAAHCGSYSQTTNPFGFATAQQARDNVVHHEAGPTNSHYAFFSGAMAQSHLNLGLLAESAVEYGPPALFNSRLRPRIEAAWDAIRDLGNVEPCNASPEDGDPFVRDSACNPVGRWNLFSPFRACP